MSSKKQRARRREEAASIAVLDRDEVAEESIDSDVEAADDAEVSSMTPKAAARAEKKPAARAKGKLGSATKRSRKGAKEDGYKLTWAERVRMRFGPYGIKTILRLMKLGMIAIVGSIDYMIVMITATNLLPVVGGYMFSVVGPSGNMPLEAMLSVWAIPTVFIVGMLFAAEYVLMRAIWRRGNAIMDRIEEDLTAKGEDK